MQDNIIISGIQQMGVGVSNVEESWKWYREYFGFEVIVFDEWADAEFMLPYTGGTPKSRHACLALNLQGGGGFEIWQHTSFTPRAANFDIIPGDLGIYSCKIKCKDAESYFKILKDKGQNVSEKVYTDATGRKFFYVRDPWNNLFQLVQPTQQQAGWLLDEGKPTGGVYGGVVGSHDADAAMIFYKEMLGYDIVLSDETKEFDDLSYLGAQGVTFRRVILGHSEIKKGPFGRLLGPSEIEIIQAINRPQPIRKIFENRMWGELGFIQICYDIYNMDGLREFCKEKGWNFTVDSMAYKNDFNMGEAGGDFAYNEDPSGSLIEYVQTNKLTIMKKLGIAINLKKRKGKALPKWMLKCLRFLKRKELPPHKA